MSIQISEIPYKEVLIDGEVIGKIALPTNNTEAYLDIGKHIILESELALILNELDRLNHNV